MKEESIKIALAGNPNAGKTTLFNALTGSNQFVGNWPGVTVEKKEGRLKKHEDITITDLPGVYSLSPYTLEEVVARNYLIGERPDAILNIVDGTNLERNLYLTTQLIELGIPVVVAINMMDVVRKNGDKINIDELARELGCKVMEISALKGEGIFEAAEEAITAAGSDIPMPLHSFSGVVEHALAHIEEAAVHHMPQEQQRWYAIKIFEGDERVLDQLALPDDVLSHLQKDIEAAEKELDDDAESIITNERYLYIAAVIKNCYKKKSAGQLSVSDKIDKVVTNRWAALPIFAVIMFLVYFISVSTVGTWVTDWANDGLFGEGWYLLGNDSSENSVWVPGIGMLAADGLEAIHCAPWLQSLVVDGIIGGVGAVLGFVPQMIVLFLLLAFLEACGYMARIAFVLDRIFRKFGLSGKSFIPMLIGTGCGVPGIMASRTIENERDRRMTVMTTTFIPCGAKLPIIAMISAALFQGAWWVAPSAYFIGIAAIVISGIMLKKTRLFAGDPAPFVMELPAYHWPTFTNVMRSMWERVSSFIKKAGTIILLSSIIIWAGSMFGVVNGHFQFSLEMELDNSVLGMLGNTICWIFAPLGFGEASATIATIMGLVAKEEVVGVFGVLELGQMSQLAAFSFLIFNLLCAPCFAAIGAIKREMNSAAWTWFAVGYQCIFAYAISLMVFQIGSAVNGNIHIVGFIAAIAIMMVILYMLFVRKYHEAQFLKRREVAS